MAMKGHIIIISCLIISMISTIQAKEGIYTLDSLIELAQDHNPELKAMHYSERSARNSARAAGSLPDPNLTLGILNLPHNSLALDETPMSGIKIGLSQSIPWFSKLSAQGQIAGLKADYLSLNLAGQSNKITRLVKENYYEFLYWTEAEELIDKNLELTLSLAEVAETRYGNGLGSAQDFLRARTMHSRLENRKQQILQQRLSALFNLRWLIDDTTLTLNRIAAGQPLMAGVAVENVDNIGITDNPTLSAASIQISIADRKLSLAKAEYWPNITLGFDYTIRQDVPMDPIRGEDFISARVGFSLPLYFFSKQKHSNRSALLALDAAREQKHAVENQLNKLLSDTQSALKTAMASIDRYDNSILPQATAAFEAARVAYEVGQVDFNALLTAQLDLLEIELERIQLIKIYYQKQAYLYELTDNGNGEIK